jgi:ppGpp synthetase/RelA/SpoT-type nucleotidyltranferase
MELTNGEINRLGESIRNNGYASNEELKKLQEFRISFSEPLFRVFNKIRILSNSINKESIVAFRLKRISTIINKIERENEMKLSRMGDIAGIRCIFNDESEVYKAFELFCKKYEISGEPKNYIKKPKEIGYKAIHIYVVDKVSKKRIEIQIKTIKQHNWATLVEITDLLYRLRLKKLEFLHMKNLQSFITYFQVTKNFLNQRLIIFIVFKRK